MADPHVSAPAAPISPAARADRAPGLGALLVAALAYWITGVTALELASTPGFASPLFPAAGVALGCVLAWGRVALPAVLLGNIALQAWVQLRTPGVDGGLAVTVGMAVAAGAVAQAAVGGWLIRRYVRGPLTLDGPVSIAQVFVLGGLLACLVNASWSCAVLLLAGQIDRQQLALIWWSWWAGDAIGAVIVTPIVLTLIGRPRAAWRPRLGTVALPLAITLLLLTLALTQVLRWQSQRGQARFERDAASVSRGVQLRLGSHLDALLAMRGVFVASENVDGAEFQRAAEPWLRQLPSVQALGWHERVPRTALADFEAAVRADGQPAFRVFERDAALVASDDEVVAMRYVEPRAGNEIALGANVLSIAAAREAIGRARLTEAPVATTGFRLTQETAGQTGVVIYQAVRHHGGPKAPLDGVVFLTLRMEDTLAWLLAEAPTYLQVCLIDADAPLGQRRLAGTVDCEAAPADAPLTEEVALPFAGRAWLLRVMAPRGVPDEALGPLASEGSTAWMFSLTALIATALLGALLLIVTGRTRLTAAAVAERTGQLEHEARERLATEQALRESERRFRSIFNTVPIGVIYTDLQGRIRQPNAAFCAMTGYSEEELLSRSERGLTHPDDRSADDHARAALVAGRTPLVRRRKRYLKRDGSLLTVNASFGLLRDEEGVANRLVGLVEDITEHLRLEQAETARESAETANRAKNEFLSRMSHELRTPLNAMLGFAQLLDMDSNEPLGERHRQWVTQIQQAGWHLLEMINDVLDLSRIESGSLKLTLEPLALEPLIAASLALVEPQAQARGIALARGAGARAPLQVMADATRMKQILSNLLSNAIKYNRDGGEVRIATRVVDAPDGSQQVELDVIDTGLGMDERQLAQLFQPFNRLGRERGGTEGTGIGLVITKLLVERQGGTLRVASRAGMGSTFTLVLPLSSVAQAPSEHGALDTDPGAYHRRRVLYIEDNEINVEVMRGVFAQRPQVQFDVATTGLDGLARLRTAPPDLLLLDMNLPDIGGMELLEHLQADPRTADIAVIVVSADALPEQISAALAAGATRYLTKPVAVDEMLSIADELLMEVPTRFG